MNSIIQSTKESADILSKIAGMDRHSISSAALYPYVFKAVCKKLMITESIADTDDIRKLAILSIKSQNKQEAFLSNNAVQNQIEKYDCHQTNLVTQKKVLLILFIEHTLNITLSDEESANITTVHELSAAICNHLRLRITQ